MRLNIMPLLTATNAKPDSNSDSDHGSAIDSNSEPLTADDSWCCSDYGDDDEVQIVWAKAGCGIWGLGHVFEGTVYFTKDIADDNFAPRIRKLKPIPQYILYGWLGKHPLNGRTNRRLWGSCACSGYECLAAPASRGSNKQQG